MLSLFTYENDLQEEQEKQHTCVWKVCRRDTAAEHSSVPATEIFGKILSIIVSASVFTIFWCGCVWGYKKAWMHKYIIDCDQSWFRSRSEVAAIEYSNYSNGRMLRRGSSNAESGSQLHSWQLGNPTKLCAAANASKQATRKCALAPSVKISNKIALGEIVNFLTICDKSGIDYLFATKCHIQRKCRQNFLVMSASERTRESSLRLWCDLVQLAAISIPEKAFLRSVAVHHILFCSSCC